MRLLVLFEYNGLSKSKVPSGEAADGTFVISYIIQVVRSLGI
jgi:hypothetical protein